MTHDPTSGRDDALTPAPPPVQPMTTPGPSRLRVGLVSGAAIILAVGAVASAFAASPANPAAGTAGTGAIDLASTTAWLAPGAVPGGIEGETGTFDHGRNGGQGRFRDITISAISGSSLSLETSDGWTRTVAVSDDMRLTMGGQAIGFGDLAVGDEIRLIQERADDGTATVTGIVVVVPNVVGEVSDLTATGFKVTGRDDTVWTVTLTGDTVYRYGASDGTLADIANGDAVLVLGTSTGDNALTATSVAVRGDRAMGTVTATTASTITIEGRDGTSVTVHVDGDTVYRVAGETGTLADIAVDDVIAAAGRARSDGSIDAAVVMDGPRGNGPGLGGGRGGHGGPGFGPGADPGVDPGFGPGFGPGGIDGGETDGTTTDAG